MTEKNVLLQQLTNKLNENEDFLKALVLTEDATSAQKVLNENGLDVSLEDVETIFADGLSEILEFKNSGETVELSEGQLEDIAGGGKLRGLGRTVISAAGGFGFGMLCAAVPAAASATPYVAGGLAAWSVAGYKKKGW